MVPHKQFPEPSPGNDLAAYRPQTLGAPATMPPATPIGQHEAIGPALWRRRWSIAGITLFALVCGLLYIHHAPKLYPGIAKITLSNSQPMVLSTTPVGSTFVPDPNWINTQIQVMESFPVIRSAALTFPQFQKMTDSQLTAEVNSIQGNLYVDPGAKDYTITVTYENPDAQAASDMANAIVKAYQDWTIQNTVQSNDLLLKTLRAKGDGLTAQRQEQLNKLLAFQAAHADFMSQLSQDPKGTLVENDTVKRLREARETARLAEIEADSNWEAAKLVHDDPDKLRAMAGGTTVAQLDADGATLRGELEAVETRIAILSKQGYGPNSPAVVQEQATAAEIEDRLARADARFADVYVGSLYQIKSNAEQKEEEYQQELDDQMKGYEEANRTAAEYQRLSDALTETTNILNSLEDQIKKLQISGSQGVITVQWIDPSMVAPYPNLPPKLRVLGIALAAGLVLGIGLGLLRDRMDTRLHTPDEVVGLLGVPVIGMIPHMRRSLTPVARGQAVHWDPMSEVAEAYRAVRTAVTFGVPAGGAKTIVVTSPTPGDGKSTLASNLAIALAQAGKRTLLLDSDFRRPVQHKLFEMSHEIGVTSVLAGRDSLNKAIQKTACEGLDLLPSGPIPLNPSELLNGESFAEILDELAGVYDHIVLDCPPVMSVTDARILGAVCDVTILVVRANKVTRKNVEHARAMLASVGARLLGCVINDVPRGQGQEGYYGGYGYAPIEPVVRRRQDAEPAGLNGHRHLPAPVDAGNGR